MNKDLTNFNKFRFNDKVLTTNKFTKQKGEFVVEETFEINLFDSRIKSIEFCWVDGMWEISDISYYQYQVDPNSPKMAGLITLASKDEITQDVMDNDDSAITPSLLEMRTSTENRKGIAKISTFDELLKGESDDSIVTPLKINKLEASESTAGIIKIASQEEVDIGLDNTKAVTPKSLENKTPDENGKRGVISLVNSEKSKPADGRGNIGGGVYDFTNDKDAVTPKTLNLLRATETSMGITYKSTLEEVLNSTENNNTPLFVHPFDLNKRIASESLKGFAKISSMNDVLNQNNSNDFDIVTPKKLHALKSNTKTQGLVRLSDDEDLKNRSDSTAITPFSLSNILLKDNIVSKSNNITISGNMWDGVEIDFNTNFNDKIKFEEINDVNNGYYFKFLKTEEDIKNYELPMINFDEIKFNEKYSYHSKDEPQYGEYLYESFKSDSKHIEKIYCDNKEWVRETTGTKSKGWVINYTYDNRPTPKEINALDKDELILGRVQVQDYLDIIIDENHRLRIHPDKDSQKVSFSLLEDYKDEDNGIS